MLATIIVVAVSIHFATAKLCESEVDETLVPGTNGSAVVDACIFKISAVFTDDDQLMLRRIAYVETHYGNDPDTYSGADNNGGIWQLSMAQYDATKTNSILNALIQSIQTEFGIDWASTQWSDLRKPFYSALAARLYLQVISASIPLSSNVDGQATYWVIYYTTSGGSEFEYVTAVTELDTQGCSVNALELFFVTDESGSVGYDNYQLMKQFVYDVTDAFEISPNDVQVGLLSFSRNNIFRFYLNTYSTKTAVLSAILGIPYTGGSTGTAAALNRIRSEAFMEANGARPASEGVPKVIIVITDGVSNDATATAVAAAGLHADGYIVFAVGISGANVAELNAIASDPAYVSFVESFDTDLLRALQRKIAEEACRASPSFNMGDVVNASISCDQVQYFNYPYDASVGMTIQINVTSGTVKVYISFNNTNPREASYNAMIETDSHIHKYILCDTPSTRVYVAVVATCEPGNKTGSNVGIGVEAGGEPPTEEASTGCANAAVGRAG